MMIGRLRVSTRGTGCSHWSRMCRRWIHFVFSFWPAVGQAGHGALFIVTAGLFRKCGCGRGSVGMQMVGR